MAGKAVVRYSATWQPYPFGVYVGGVRIAHCGERGEALKLAERFNQRRELTMLRGA